MALCESRFCICKDKKQAKWTEEERRRQLQKTRTREQDNPDQGKHRRESSRAGRRPRETTLTISLLHFLENGGDWRMGPP